MNKYDYSENKYCECGKLITNKSKKCNSCAFKGENASGYIDGRSLKKYYCECGNKITNDNALYGNGLCRSCSQKNRFGNIEKEHCKDCNKELINSRAIRCHSCEMKRRYIQNPELIKNSIKNLPTDNKKEKHYNWQNGKSFEEYPMEFNSELKEQIRERDKYECQNCGMTEEEHIIVNGQVLHIHHIDYNKKNCNKTNLITTCQQCNIRANFNKKYWIEFYTNKIRGIDVQLSTKTES